MGVVVPCSASVKVEVVRVLAFMASENVASTLALGATFVAWSSGATLLTVGGVVSAVVPEDVTTSSGRLVSLRAS